MFNLLKVLKLWALNIFFTLTCQDMYLLTDHETCYNISPEAVRFLFIGTKVVTFLGSVGGVPVRFEVPVNTVTTIVSKLP